MPVRAGGGARRFSSRRIAVAAALANAALVVVLALILIEPSKHDPHATTTRTSSAGIPARATRTLSRPTQLVEHRQRPLGAAVQDSAAVPLGGTRAMVVGGLNAADTSRADIRVVDARGDRLLGSLPVAVHDTAAARIGRYVYVFGGGTNSGTQADSIVRVAIASGTTADVGRLPAPSSDQSAAVVGGTAYVVGGYTGTRWLNTIVAWAPGSGARVVAHLPFAVRYAAVAAVDGTIVIAGGSLENGTASAAVLDFRPGHGVRRIGRLPAATTHAAAAAIGGVAFVIGGRGAQTGSVTDSIVSIDVRKHRIRNAGTLAFARSDEAAVSLGTRILLVGGRDQTGAIATRSELVPARVRRTQSVTATRSVYAFDGANRLTGAARFAKPLVYVPNSQSASVDVIDPRTYKVIERFPVGLLPQHVVPSYDLRTLYVTNDVGNSLTVIDPRTGKPGRSIPVEDPYNMYFTPGRPVRDRRGGAGAPARLPRPAHVPAPPLADRPMLAASTTWTSPPTAAT